MNKGVGMIDLDSSIETIIKILGSPDLDKLEFKEDGDSHRRLFFNKYKINIFIHKEYNGNSEMSIHLSNIKLDGVLLKDMQMDSVLEVIEKFHVLRKIKYEFDFTIDDIETFYDFYNIGLSIWFEKLLVSDICVTNVRSGL